MGVDPFPKRGGGGSDVDERGQRCCWCGSGGEVVDSGGGVEGFIFLGGEVMVVAVKSDAAQD